MPCTTETGPETETETDTEPEPEPETETEMTLECDWACAHVLRLVTD